MIATFNLYVNTFFQKIYSIKFCFKATFLACRVSTVRNLLQVDVGRFIIIRCKHGAGALGEDNVKQFVEFKTAVGRINQDCFVLLPQQSSAFAQENTENLEIYAKSLKNMIELLAQSYPIDTSRIYLTGISLGGACVWYSLYNCPGFYAAGIPLMGYMPEAYSSVFRKENFAGAKIWAGHAKDDKLVPADSDINIYNKIKDVCSIKFSLYDEDGHRMMRAFYGKEPWQKWLFAQHKGND